MSQIGIMALNYAMALTREQSDHSLVCLHCNYMLSGLEKEGSVVIIHEESCPVLSANNFVAGFNQNMKDSVLN
jgi:hypothetical protein